MNLTEIIENLPEKPIVNIKRLKENNIYNLYYDEEHKEYKTVIIDDSPNINDKSQLLDIQVELNRLKYAQIKQRILEKSRDVSRVAKKCTKNG
ncbi:hypothetical protein KJ688_14570, partial [bacterium]|nr:hypothetical protein [bacterium]